MAKTKKYKDPSPLALEILYSLERLECQYYTLEYTLQVLDLPENTRKVIKQSLDSLKLQIDSMHRALKALADREGLDPKRFVSSYGGPGGK